MTHYKATFSNGETKEIANSKREYAAAWRFVADASNATGKPGTTVTAVGFARTHELAAKAIAGESRFWTKDQRPRWNGDKGYKGLPLISSEIVAVEIL